MGGKNSKVTSNFSENINKLSNMVHNENDVKETFNSSIDRQAHIENISTMIQNISILTLTDVMTEAKFDFKQFNKAILKFNEECDEETEDLNINIEQSNRAVVSLEQKVNSTVENKIASKFSKKLVANLETATL
jgi:hypothetical protein